MKINEILAEGFWKGVGQAVGIDTSHKPFRTAAKGQTSSQYTFTYGGKTYKWMGQQWGVQNPTTGKFSPAPKEIQDQLNAASGSAVKQRPDTATTTPTASPDINTSTIKPIAKIGTPSDAEQANLQAKIQAALKAQG